jgi:hypothetical protein
MLAVSSFYLEFHVGFFGLNQQLFDCLLQGLTDVLFTKVFDVV